MLSEWPSRPSRSGPQLVVRLPPREPPLGDWTSFVREIADICREEQRPPTLRDQKVLDELAAICCDTPEDDAQPSADVSGGDRVQPARDKGHEALCGPEREARPAGPACPDSAPVQVHLASPVAGVDVPAASDESHEDRSAARHAARSESDRNVSCTVSEGLSRTSSAGSLPEGRRPSEEREHASGAPDHNENDLPQGVEVLAPRQPRPPLPASPFNRPRSTLALCLPANTRSDLRRLEALVHGHTVVPRDRFAREAELMQTKWPGYRFMPPIEATLRFIEEYRAAYRRCVGRHFDQEHARNVKPANCVDIEANNKHLTQFWVARQHADERFIPYSEYLDFNFDFWTRRTRQKLPQPNQLRPSTEAQKVAWEAEFAKFWTADRIHIELNRMQPLAQYRMEAEAALPAQVTYRDTLLALAREEGISLNSFVGTFVVARREVPVRACVALFGEDVVRSAVLSAKQDIKLGLLQTPAYEPMEKADHWQACFGVLGLASKGDSPCSRCPQSADCAVMQRLVEQTLVRRHGHPDPLLAKKRRQGRERTALCRARKAAAAGTDPTP